MEKEIDVDICIVVEQPDGRVVQTDDGRICLQNKSDGEIFFVKPSEEICRRFNLQWEPSPSTSNEHSTSEPEAQTKARPLRWSKEAILTLIKLRIVHDKEFKSTTTKNEVIWKKISEELKAKGYNVTTNQCNDKWKYLKARYTAQKDNMGDRGTGEAPCQFAYFDEMDSFLGQKHSIQPQSIGSSIQGDTMTEEEGPDNSSSSHSEQDVDMEPPQQKKKKISSEVTKRVKSNKTVLQKILEDMQQSRVERDNNRKRRHQEMMNVRNEAVSVFSAKMDLLIETLKK